MNQRRKTIGSDPGSDLVLEQPGVWLAHAIAELAGDGVVSVRRATPDAPLFLHRAGRWLEVQRVGLCVDDRIRFGPHELPLSRLSGLFGAAAGARLRPRPGGPPPAAPRAPATPRPGTSPGPLRRNPQTGKIEH